MTYLFCDRQAFVPSCPVSPAGDWTTSKLQNKYGLNNFREMCVLLIGDGITEKYVEAQDPHTHEDFMEVRMHNLDENLSEIWSRYNLHNSYDV